MAVGLLEWWAGRVCKQLVASYASGIANCLFALFSADGVRGGIAGLSAYNDK